MSDILGLIVFVVIAVIIKNANKVMKDADTSEHDARNSRKASLQQVKTKTAVKTPQRGYQAPANPITKPAQPIPQPVVKYNEPAAAPAEPTPVQMPLPFVRDEAGEKVGLDRKPLVKKELKVQEKMPKSGSLLNNSKEGKSKPIKSSGEGETLHPDFQRKPAAAEVPQAVPVIHCGKAHIELTPSSLRSMVVMNEILDRPVALRRRRAR